MRRTAAAAAASAAEAMRAGGAAKPTARSLAARCSCCRCEMLREVGRSKPRLPLLLRV